VTIYYFLVGTFVVSLLMALYLTLAGTAQSAHSGQFLGERWHWGHLTQRKKVYDFLNQAIFTARFSEVV
jgi:hypothetical protein